MSAGHGMYQNTEKERLAESCMRNRPAVPKYRLHCWFNLPSRLNVRCLYVMYPGAAMKPRSIHKSSVYTARKARLLRRIPE